MVSQVQHLALFALGHSELKLPAFVGQLAAEALVVAASASGKASSLRGSASDCKQKCGNQKECEPL